MLSGSGVCGVALRGGLGPVARGGDGHWQRAPHPTATDRPIRSYLRAYAWKHGRGRTAKAFGVSRHTLWRFLDRGQTGRAPAPRHHRPGRRHRGGARVGDARTRRRRSSARTAPPRPVPAGPPAGCAAAALRDAVRQRWRALSLQRDSASTLRGRLAELRARGLADARPHRLAELGARPRQRFFPPATVEEPLELEREPVARSPANPTAQTHVSPSRRRLRGEISWLREAPRSWRSAA